MDHSQPQSQSLKEDCDDDDVAARPNASASFDMSLLSSPSPRTEASVVIGQPRVHCSGTASSSSTSSFRNKPPYLRASASWDENEHHFPRSSRLIHNNTPAKRKLEHHSRKPKRSLETCTTATDSLDGPIGGCGNDNSSTTSSSSDFTHLHFANFPASLPRLAPPLEHNPHHHHLLLHHSNDLGYSLEDNEDDDDHEEREDTDEKSSLIMTPSPRTRLNFHSFSPATIPTSSLLPILPPSKTSSSSTTSSSSIMALHNHCDATTTATTTSPEALFLGKKYNVNQPASSVHGLP